MEGEGRVLFPGSQFGGVCQIQARNREGWPSEGAIAGFIFIFAGTFDRRLVFELHLGPWANGGWTMGQWKQTSSPNPIMAILQPPPAHT
jgi:hypothetical protein